MSVSEKASTAYDMEISAEKTKLMTNNTSGINTELKVHGQKFETVTSFKYLGWVIADEGSKLEILFIQKILPIFSLRDRLFCMVPIQQLGEASCHMALVFAFVHLYNIFKKFIASVHSFFIL